MGTTSKQVMDIKTSKGLSQTSNEELRAWTDKGCAAVNILILRSKKVA